MPIHVTVHRPGHATGTATSHAGETYSFSAVQPMGEGRRVVVTLYGRLKGRAGFGRTMPRSTLTQLRSDIAKACRHASGWQDGKGTPDAL